MTIAKPSEFNLNDGTAFACVDSDKGVPTDGWTCPNEDGCKAFIDGGSGEYWNYGSLS